RLPADMRMRIVSSSHGPAGGWYMRQRILETVPYRTGWTPLSAELVDGRIQLQLAAADGTCAMLPADHVIAATGYRVDLRKIGFLDAGLLSGLDARDGIPVLSRRFETSVHGLYVVGPAAAFSFGPMFRFVLGARYTARRLAPHLAAAAPRRPMIPRPALAAR
ncbi:MAG TPA: NAD(P)/FAD-dependent oxidoreductase, partial [Stellaceae bacterium]|nr:NAD(P)/FAD-dependent oxidoreductase [Stellaceae bacterium]